MCNVYEKQIQELRDFIRKQKWSDRDSGSDTKSKKTYKWQR